jgi:hypothetical protein
MHPNHDVSFQFCEVLRSVAALPDADQILELKMELLYALERASHAQRRCLALERDLAHSKADAQEEFRALRLEVLAMVDQRETLDEVCRSLLVTIEQAACSELGAAADPERMVGVSS